MSYMYCDCSIHVLTIHEQNDVLVCKLTTTKNKKTDMAPRL